MTQQADAPRNTGPFGGHDGPYPGPARTAPQRVLAEWIDFNGHMNVGYYSVAFDRSVEQIWDDMLGLGESLAKGARMGPYILQSHLHYLAELKEGAQFEVSLLLLAADAKRAHTFLQMHDLASGVLSATCEQITVNVDLVARRSTPFPDWGQRRLSQMLQDHAGVERPRQLGQGIGLRARRE